MPDHANLTPEARPSRYAHWLLAALPFVLGAKCVEYDPQLAASTTPAAPPDGGSLTCTEAPPRTPENMLPNACFVDRCVASLVVAYWGGAARWSSVAVQRRVTFQEQGGNLTMVVTDGFGAPATLELAFGVPVTLTIINPGTTTAPHDFTAPRFFRSVAWLDATTSSGTYRAPHFDAFTVAQPAPASRVVTLRFVPIVAGSYSAWSAGGDVSAAEYADLAAGGVLGGAEAQLSINVQSAYGFSLFQEMPADRFPELDVDARRDAGHAVWTTPADIDISTIEIDQETFDLQWSVTDLQVGIGYQLQLTNPSGNFFEHNMTAPALMQQSVLRGVADPTVEVHASYLDTINISPGAVIDIFLVPTVAARYHTYCRLQVVTGSGGVPDLTTGHPSRGMQQTITVNP
jgi:hypothetical protein